MTASARVLKALERVHAALEPLDPEQRRQVVEAAHALLEISAGKKNGPPQAGSSRSKS